MKNLKILKTADDYQNALNRLDEVIDAEMGTNEGDELELLALLIKDYEDKNYPIKLPDPLKWSSYGWKKWDLKIKTW